jgi:hypothetical protein
MRATGFFFATDTQTYLVTARHNLLPTTGATLATGNWSLSYETDEYLSIIDVYLRDTASLTQHRIDIRDAGVRYHNKFDVVGVPVDLTPQEYGYTVWTPTDITSSISTGNQLETIGFPGGSFPSKNGTYDTEQYANDIENPYVLTLNTEFPGTSQPEIDTGLIDVAFDTDDGTQSSEYRGLSGSPVLGEGLVGIHQANQHLVPNDSNMHSNDDEMALVYGRAAILPKLLE